MCLRRRYTSVPIPCMDWMVREPPRYSAYAREVGSPNPNPCMGPDWALFPISTMFHLATHRRSQNSGCNLGMMMMMMITVIFKIKI